MKFYKSWLSCSGARYGCDFITYMYRLLIANVFWLETANI